MSPKKQLEVQVLAGLVHSVAEEFGIDLVMDLGAGQGYLDSVLCYQYGKIVIGVDDDQVQTCGAKRRSNRLLEQYGMTKTRAAMSLTAPHPSGLNVPENGANASCGRMFHINRRVSHAESFASLLSEVVPTMEASMETANAYNSKLKEGWLLCGLHSCGDLSVAAIRHFLESDARALVLVSCCYNKLSEYSNKAGRVLAEDESNMAELGGFGYPLSSYLRKSCFTLGFTARTLACQATCRWDEDWKDSSSTEPAVVQESLNHEPAGVSPFTRHHFRALLQVLLKETGLLDYARQHSASSPEQDVIVGRLRSTAFNRGFVAYAKVALPKLGIDLIPDLEYSPGHSLKTQHPARPTIVESVASGIAQRFAWREKQIAAVWTLRAMMGSAIESLILIDRVLFLAEASENVDSVKLFPLFDPVDSPRNMVLVATKKRKGSVYFNFKN
ncbi:methyltransferase domain-containing protein [Zopfochytrium polystomum]|nr:methyltransferase domain-containing protein [Zopfochytrium polystomum]